MNARAVNVAILLLLTLELGTGLGSFLVGEPDGRWLFWLHRAGGLALVVLLLWKVGIAASSYRRRGFGIGTGLSTVFGVLFLGLIATGLLWSTVGLPWIPVPVVGSWTVLSLHVALSLLLIPLFVVHLGLRWPRPSRADLLGRRALLRMLGLLVVGFSCSAWSVPQHATRASRKPPLYRCLKSVAEVDEVVDRYLSPKRRTDSVYGGAALTCPRLVSDPSCRPSCFWF
jgi:hypothetical protein